MVQLKTLFTIQYGSHNINSKGNLDEGDTLVISSKGTDNGSYGFFDVKKRFKKPVISVPRTGSVGEAFVQIHPCNIDDNCLVLIPKRDLKIEYLFYIAQVVRNEKWRYMYGRQITPQRIESLEVLSEDKFSLPFSYDDITEEKVRITKAIAQNIEKILPNKDDSFTGYEEVLVTKLFKVRNAHSKGFKKYRKGKVPFISNGYADNGFVGFVTPNKNDRVFYKDSICVSAFCEATVQRAPFLPRGNGGSGLKVLTPLTSMTFEELIFHASYINRVHSWKFSYGRMATKDRVKEIKILAKKIT